MGRGIPKQFRPLAGTPLFRWSLCALQECSRGVTLVVPLGATGVVQDACVREAAVRVVTGGVLRQDSVAHGLAAVPEECTVVLVHDAARPFLPLSMAYRVLDACGETGMAVPALPVPDTIKRSADGQRVTETIDRKSLFLAQTPQACSRDLLEAMVSAAPRHEMTDESGGAERLGVVPRMVEGSPFAFKITTESDFTMAEAVAAWLITTGSAYEDWHWVRHTSAG
jgi:2-C-methyl-D-erythritol 4-phosphate cytidylyltransferase